MCMCAYVCAYQSIHAEVRGELVGVGSLLLLCGFWGSNLDHQMASKLLYSPKDSFK